MVPFEKKKLADDEFISSVCFKKYMERVADVGVNSCVAASELVCAPSRTYYRGLKKSSKEEFWRWISLYQLIRKKLWFSLDHLHLYSAWQIVISPSWQHFNALNHHKDPNLVAEQTPGTGRTFWCCSEFLNQYSVMMLLDRAFPFC